MSSNPPPTIQETLGSYNIIEKIAEGSMGAVYKAQHWETKEIVAVKIMPPNIAKNPVLIKRFEQEFRVASKLNHPNIVKAVEYCGTGATPFLVMEFVDGLSLGEKLDREGKMTEEDAISIIVQVAHGLHRAHRQGLIHRDVKPDNILVTADGTAKLTDLGLAKDIDTAAELTRTGRGLGTPNFMAPEQFRNAKNADIRCDVYSLAATLYQMVTNELPFGDADPVQLMMRKMKNELVLPRKIVPALSERTEWTIRRAMSADPRQRPNSCREFVEDLIGQSTRPGSSPDVESGEQDIWYMVFTDAQGTMRTAKGTTTALRRSLGGGQLGQLSQVRASRSTGGPFELLEKYPEYRDLVVGPAEAPPLSERSMANLSQMFGSSVSKLAAAANFESEIKSSPTVTPPAAPPRPVEPLDTGSRESVPYFQVPGSAPVAARTMDTVKLIALVVFTVVLTLVASKFLLPFLR
jgi:serine/threonine protein kinase